MDSQTRRIMEHVARWVKEAVDADWDQPVVHHILEGAHLGAIRSIHDTIGIGPQRLRKAMEDFLTESPKEAHRAR